MRLTTIVAIAAISLFSHTWADGMNYWIGPTNNSWDTAGANWSLGYVPGADDTAVFTNDYRLIKIKSGHAASNVVFEAGSRVRFSRTDGGDQAAFGFKEINGGGKLELFSTGLQANYASFAECPVSVSEIEIINDTSYSTKVSWFDGGSNEGSRMVVGSSVSGAGKLECRGNVTLAGETTATGSLKLDSGSVVKKLVYDNGGCNVTSDSAGTVEQVLVRGGTLAYSSSALAAATGVSVGRFALEGGTLSVGGDFSGKVASGTGFGTLFLEGDWADADSVALPSGISFVDGEDAARLDVRAAVAGREHRFSVAESGGVYVLETKGAIWNIDALDFSLMTILAGQGSPKANKSINGNSIRLWDGEKAVTFSRGIGTHAPSRWFVKLGGKGISMSVCVGVDYEAYGKTGSGDGKSPNVNFIILDVERGLKLAESGEMTDSTPYKRLAVDLAGVETIELVMDGLDSTSWDHADWADGVILMEPGFSPVTKGPNHWVGRGTDTNWDTAANWEFGVPREDATAVFDASANVILDSSKTISNIVVNAGATVRFRTGRLYSVWPSLIIQETGGDGTMQFSIAGLQANHVNSNTVYINTANIEFQSAESDDWFTAGGAEGQELVVNSRVKVQGFMRAYSGVHFVGDLVLDGGSIYLSDKAVVEKLVLDSALKFGKSNDNPPVDSTGKINEIVVHGTTYNYSDFADKTWPLTVDGGSVDIGDGSSIGSSGLELGVLSGGYLRYTVSELPASGVPAFPQNLTFADGADLTTVFAIVKNSSGDAQKTYTISKSGDVYSFAEAVPTDTVKWIGGVDDNWFTPGNWIYGAVPADGQSVVFDRSANLRLTAGKTAASVGTITIAEGAVVRFETTDEWGWDNGPIVPFAKITGGGVLQLKHAQLRGAPAEGESAVIECGGIEILSHANNDTGRSSILDGPVDGAPMIVTADISGVGYLKALDRIAFGGDNSGFKGEIHCDGSNGYGNADRYFDTPGSFFPNARLFYFRGRIFINFADGTAPMGNVDVGESWGASLVMKDGANVTLEVASGKINDSHNGDGFEVWTRAEGADDYLRVTGLDTGSGYTKGCAGLTIKKVGEGTLVYGLTKAHNLVVAEGRVEFTGENNNGDDSDVNVTVKAGASIGTPEAFSHENPNWALGGDVTVRHQFTFEPGGAIKQEYIATPVMVEQVEPVYENEEFVSNIVSLVESGDYTYSMRKLTIADDVDLANVVFGVTNPEDLPAVTKAAVAGLPRFTMFAANSLIGTVATENDGYAPDGSAKNCKWLFRTKRNSVNEVELYPFQKSGFAVIVR